MTPSLLHEPRSRGQIVAATEILREVLGAEVVAAYLFGSAVAGGLRPGSDLDILAVSARSLTGGERSAIIRRLLPISGRNAIGGPGRSIELTIVARPALTPWRHPVTIELQYGEWMRAELEQGDAPTWPHPDPDAVVLIETARRAAVPLLGPPAVAILETAPRADLARAMLDLVPILLPGIEEGNDRRNGLLTLARIWTTLATGEIRPKDGAADWALAQLPAEHRPVLAHARAAYLAEAPEDWRDLEPRVRPHVDHVVALIRSFA
ncbi:aminoglycoside adenylyltransferase family protein [Siccirubricoccus phaeus]|uniref:aminoglycoside adenylyltransferase family protein n=1 Tax=Siccirubricoccus phaeus TaxID=2595053 RepID=UPI0011F22033|nr:aminoglycoside adenylyltransferase family protein [Siccirubricoccus phaeus]